MSEKEALESNIELFKEIIINIQGCQKSKPGGKNFFNCSGCECLGDCFHTSSECIAVICQWIIDQLEANSEGRIMDKIKEIMPSEEDSEETIINNTENLYL